MTAAKGPSKPYSAKRVANTEDRSRTLQPNSTASGCISTPGKPSAAEVTSMAKKVMAAITQA